MSNTDKTNKQDSPGFVVNPMNMYGVAGCGIPLPVFTPQFGPMLPLRMMTPMWPVSPSLLPPCTGNVSGTSAKPKSDAADNEVSSNDQSDGKTVPSIWALNASSMQEYIQNMSTSVLKSSDGLGTACAGMMMAPMWPMNAAFLQQCIGSLGGATSNPVAKETSCENKAEKEGVTSATAASGVQGPTSTVCGDEKAVVASDSTAEADKGGSDAPHTASSAIHVDKVPEVAFPGGTPFMPFSNIAGFIPYTTYIPCFKPVDINQRSSADQQVESSKSANKTEHSIPGQVPDEQKSVSDPVDMEQEHTEKNLTEELGENEQDEVSISNDSGCSGVSDTGNSAEMDVAQILVNFMPVPVIGSTGQEGTEESDGEQEASVLVMEEGTASLAEPQADSNAAMDESASSMGELQCCPADKVTTEENQQDIDEGKAQITQEKMSIQITTEVNPRVDSMEVSVIKNSKDVIMEAQETSTGHSPTLLRENGPQLSEMRKEENVISGGHGLETDIEKQVLQPVLNKQAPPDISDEQVSPPPSVEMSSLETSNGQAVPRTSAVATVEPVVEAQMTQPELSTPASELMLVECRDCGVQAGPNALESQITTSVPNGDVPAQPCKDQVRANSTMMQVVQSVLEGQVALGVSKMEVTVLPLSQHVVSSLSEMPVVEVKQERDDSVEYQVEGNSSNGAEIKGGIPKMAEMAYKCEVCSQLFRSPLGLQKHLEFHSDDGQHYTCTICFERFQDSDTLQGHVAYHMRKRPHKCNFCPKAFRDPGSLQKHVRVHTGEKPYKCTNCFRSFAEYSSLRKHLRVHTGEQPYKCQYCTKAFSISGNLQRHTLIHTGERPYKCSFCPKAFNNPSHLRRHVKNLHFKGEGGSGAEVMIAMAAAVAAAEGKMALGNGQLAVGAPATASNTAVSTGSFTDTAPQKNNKEQTGILADQNIMKVDFPAAATQPDNIK